jgi:putative ABC transport system permease protein
MVSSVRVRLQSPSSFDAFQAAVEKDKRLGLSAMRETAFNEKQSEGTAQLMTIIGLLIAVFFGMGAAIGATVTMYTSISSREREVGTLRALGFGRPTIMGSFLLEALFIALAGGVLGVLASLLMGFVRFSTMNFASWSEIVFTFTPTPGILISAMVVAGVTGLLGGLYPAWKASKMSPVAAMKR